MICGVMLIVSSLFWQVYGRIRDGETEMKVQKEDIVTFVTAQTPSVRKGTGDHGGRV